jgi:hypothetical protein
VTRLIICALSLTGTLVCAQIQFQVIVEGPEGPVGGATKSIDGNVTNTGPLPTDSKGSSTFTLIRIPPTGVTVRVSAKGYQPFVQAGVKDYSQAFIVTLAKTPDPAPTRPRNPSNPSVRASKPPPPSVVEALIKQYETGNADSQLSALAELGKMGRDAAPAAPKIAANLSKQKEAVVLRAIGTLRSIGAESDEINVALILALKDQRSCQVQASAASALSVLGIAGTELDKALRIASQDSCTELRLNAALALLEKGVDRKGLSETLTGSTEFNNLVFPSC